MLLNRCTQNRADEQPNPRTPIESHTQFERQQKRFLRTAARGTTGYRWAAMLLLALLVTATAFAQEALYGYTTTSLVVAPVVATTAPPTGSYRAQYVVSMSQIRPNGAVELRAFSDSTTALTRIGDVILDEEPINAYALATLDANRVVSAYVDNNGTLYVAVWVVGPADFYMQGQGSAPSSGFLGIIPGFAAPVGVSITALSPTEVATAATDPSGNLRVQTWGISSTGAVTPPQDPQDTAIGGPIAYPYIVAINANQVVTVDDTNLASDGVITANSTREVIAWQVNSDGAITRQGSLSVPENGYTSGLAVGPLGGFLGGGYSVITGSIDQATDELEVNEWSISQTGGQVTAGLATSTKNQFCCALIAAVAWSPNLAPFTVVEASAPGPSTGVYLELWNVENNSWYVFGSNYDASAGYVEAEGWDYGAPVGGLAVAAEGIAGSHGYFVVAVTNSALQLVLQVCSAPYS
jgi:hypothetical protein